MFFLCIQPMLRFRLFAVCIRQLAHKMSNVTTLLQPRLDWRESIWMIAEPDQLKHSALPVKTAFEI